MEMKFAKFRTDERCKKLERSLKLALLRKSGRTTNEGQANPFSLPSSISSINTDTQDLNYTASFTQTFQTENEVVSSSNNLRNIMAKRRNMYSSDNQMVTSSSIKQSLKEKNHFDSKTMALLSQDVDMPDEQFKANPKIPKRDLLKSGDYLLSPIEKNSYSLPVKDRHISDSAMNSEVKHAKNRSDNIDNSSPPKLVSNNISNGHERTFFNWRVTLNDYGHLLVKGKLECGKVARSKPIVKRLTATSVQSMFRQIYHLEGNIVDNRNELPEYVRGKFHNGFPDDWENVHQIWLLYVSNGCKPNFHWPTKITDSDDDIKSEMTDCTFLCTKEVQKERSTVDIPKIQLSNNSNVQQSPSNVCNIDGKTHTYTSKAKVNNASNSNTHIPASRNTFISGETMEVHNLKIWDKENQHKNENESMHKMFFSKKNTMRDLIKQDKIDIIIRNLLHKDCPKEYILKILQMFDFLDDVFSFRMGTDETNSESIINEKFPTVASESNNKESDLHSNQTQDNQTEINLRSSILGRNNISPMKQYIINNENNKDMHKISSRILEKQSQGLQNASEKKDNTVVPLSHTKNSDESENETYAGVPRIISDCILKSTEKYSFKRVKYKKKRKTSEVNPMIRNDVKSNKRFKKDKPRLHCSSSSDDDIENRRKERLSKMQTFVPALPIRENPGNIHYNSSVSITEDEELQVEKKLDSVGVCKRKETNNLTYNRMLDISNADDKIELSKSKYKNTRNVVRCESKKPEVVNNNHNADYIDDTLGRNNESNIRSYSEIAKWNAFKNHCITNEKKRNKDISESKLDDIICINDGQINRSENSSRVRQISGGSKCQVKSGIVYETDKSTNCKKVMEAMHEDNKISDCMKDSIMNELINTDKCKQLCNWVPRIVYDTNSDVGLVFEGKLLNEAGHVVHRKFITERIHKRLSPIVIETTNHELYQLVGDLHDSKHVVPKEIVRHCRKGCPSDINQFCRLWRSLEEGDPSKATSKEENETVTDLLSMPTSSKGRKKFPPLCYWNGERVTVKDDKVVYTAGNCNNYSIDSLTDDRKNRSIFQEEKKLNEHFKTVETRRPSAVNEENSNVIKYPHTSAEKARIKESKRHERLIDVPEKDDNTVYHMLKHRMGKYVQKDMRFDIKCGKLHKTGKDNDATAQLDEHKHKYNAEQESPAKMQNLKYLCYKNIPPEDDILSDDQISQF